LKSTRDHPRVGREIAKARDWYDKEEPGLGRELVLEIDRVLSLIAQGVLPTLPHPTIPGVRRVMLKRFPFWIVLLEREHEVVVIAVAHMKRRPEYWLSRLR
jgi:toxin ParE1/3/4